MTMGSLLVFLAAAVLATLLALALWLRQARRHWHEAGDRLRAHLLARAAEGPAPGVVSLPSAPSRPGGPPALDALPAPVQRYLNLVLRPGQAAASSIAVRWTGKFNLGPPGRDRWVPFDAEQLFVPAVPGFVWEARMAMAPGVQVWVRDALLADFASMQARVLGAWPVVDRPMPGEQIAAALQRYLGESIWFPEVLQPGRGVRWTAIDDRRARATVRSGAVEASLEFRFGADGLVEAVHTDRRRFDDGRHPPVDRPWQAVVHKHGEVDGQCVPVDASVEWLLPEGRHAYWRGRPLALRRGGDAAR